MSGVFFFVGYAHGVGLTCSALKGPLMNLDDCPPHGIKRPQFMNDLVVNGQAVVACYDCDNLFTTDNCDLDDSDYLWRCYGCLSLDTGDGWGITPK